MVGAVGTVIRMQRELIRRADSTNLKRIMRIERNLPKTMPVLLNNHIEIQNSRIDRGRGLVRRTRKRRKKIVMGSRKVRVRQGLLKKRMKNPRKWKGGPKISREGI